VFEALIRVRLFMLAIDRVISQEKLAGWLGCSHLWLVSALYAIGYVCVSSSHIVLSLGCNKIRDKGVRVCVII